MTDSIHPNDKLDAILWAIEQVRRFSPPCVLKDQMARNRMIVLKQLRDETQREARK
jgi:hypothetical protein